MLSNITKGTDIKDWTVRDVENLDEHLWTNLKTTLKDKFENTTFRGETLDDFSKRPKETRQSLMEEYNTKAAAGVCSPGIVKALKEIVSYNTGLIEALKNRFGDDFKDLFVKEIKYLLYFNSMLTLGDKIKNREETYDGCLARVKAHENESLRKIVERQDSEN